LLIVEKASHVTSPKSFRTLLVLSQSNRPEFNKLNSVICISLSLGVLFFLAGNKLAAVYFALNKWR
jgi:hypothetical protein